MCYNCGCELPHDPMGKKPVREGGPSLVEEDMEVWAKENKVTLNEIKSNLYEQLGCDCNPDHKPPKKKIARLLSNEKLQSMSTEWGMNINDTKHNICHLLCETSK